VSYERVVFLLNGNESLSNNSLSEKDGKVLILVGI